MFNSKEHSDNVCACYQYAPIFTRIALGIVFFVHGYQKLFIQGIDGVAGFFGSVGIPAAFIFAYVVTLLEFFGGIALIFGLFTRFVAALFVIDMIAALFAVHLQNGFSVSNGGYEFVFVLAAASFSLVFSGAGAYALDSLFAGGPRSKMQADAE